MPKIHGAPSRLTDRQELLLPNPNPLGLKFYEPNKIENLVLNEIDVDYRFWDIVPELNSNSIVLDIGGHTGVVSMFLAKSYGCRVHCFEPALYNFKRLCENIKINNLEELVFPHNLAVTKDGRDVIIGNDPWNWGSNNIYYGEGDPVKSISPADIMKAYSKNGHVDLFKIDCERAEFEIFEDMTPFKGTQVIRGEFHCIVLDDIADLLVKVQKVVPNTRVNMQYSPAQVLKRAADAKASL
jgi:FkbM family methyltransferase